MNEDMVLAIVTAMNEDELSVMYERCEEKLVNQYDWEENRLESLKAAWDDGDRYAMLLNLLDWFKTKYTRNDAAADEEYFEFGEIAKGHIQEIHDIVDICHKNS